MNELMQSGGAYIRRLRALEVEAQERAFTKHNRKLIRQNKSAVLPGLLQYDLRAPRWVRAGRKLREWRGM